jgi:hypothetical protein
MGNPYRVSIRNLCIGEAAFIVDALEARAEEYHRQADALPEGLEADVALASAYEAESLATEFHAALIAAPSRPRRYSISGSSFAKAAKREAMFLPNDEKGV